jgi:TonB family protein
MWFDSTAPRLNITVVVSLGVHVLALSFLASHKFSEAPERLKLTEVEFQEEVVKQSEMEKLMTKLVAPQPEPPRAEEARIAAIEEIQKESFRQVVGMKAPKPLEEVTDLDLTRLAALPKFDLAKQAPPPAIAAQPTRRIALVRAAPSVLAGLESQVVPVEELPPADFGPEISKRGFQQPELIIKKVKAERREQSGVDTAKKLSLARGGSISGEVKDREILHRENPPVPRWLEEKGVEAEVVIRFVVNPDGEVGDKIFVEKTSGYAELDRLAIEALKKFMFAPLPLNVRQVEQSGTIMIRFTFK